MAGYQLASDDLRDVPPKYICKQCRFVLRDPLQTPCAHFYCRDCLECLKRGALYKCNVDGEEFDQSEVFPDGCVRKEIHQLPVRCLNQDKGCKWQGKIEALDEHVSLCDFVEITCVFKECGKNIIKSRLAEHLEAECSQRQVKCDLCSEEMPQAKLEEHKKKVCRLFPISCSLCDKKDIPRGQLSSHHDPITGDCKETQAVCSFRLIGCNTAKEMKRKEKQQHDKSLVFFHLNLLVRFVFSLKDQVESCVQEINPVREGLGRAMGRLNHTVSQLVSQVATVARDTTKTADDMQALRSRLARVEECSLEVDSMPARHSSTVYSDMKRGLGNLKANIANHDLLFVEANRTMEEQNNEIVWLKRQVDNYKEALRKLQAKVDSLEQGSRTRNHPATGQLQNSVGSHESNSFDGTLVWRIANVSDKMYEAMNAAENSFYSPPFYTSSHGYKMCARIYLNGDGMGKGTHISLFFVIMRGQYDALLRWPFRQKVTMMLLDQDNVEHVIDAFRPDPNSSSFQRPRRELNIASGCPLFFPLADISKHAYIKDDVMFIKILVDCTDL